VEIGKPVMNSISGGLIVKKNYDTKKSTNECSVTGRRKSQFIEF